MKKKYLDIPTGEKVVIVFPKLKARLFGIAAFEQDRTGNIAAVDISQRRYELGRVVDQRGLIDLQYEQEFGNMDHIAHKLTQLCKKDKIATR